MPISAESFRAVCGHFVPIFITFMTKRARLRAAMHIRVLKVRSCALAFALTVVIATLLYRSGSVELNPGPMDRGDTDAATKENNIQQENTNIHGEETVQNQAIMSAIHQLRTEVRGMTDKVTTELQSLKNDIGTVISKCQELEKKCDSLKHRHNSLEERVFNNETYLDEVEDTKKENDRQVKTLTDEIERLKTDVDRLESFSRRDNLRFFGLGPETADESFPVCAKKVVSALNSVRNPRKQWTEDDITRAHRTGQTQGNKPRPMIVRFARWKDKQALLSDQTMREELREKGIRIANDLTNRQAALVAGAKKDGKFGYIKNGKLVVVDRAAPKTGYTSRNSDRGNVNNNSRVLPEQQLHHQRDRSPFHDASDYDNESSPRRSSTSDVAGSQDHRLSRSPDSRRQGNTRIFTTSSDRRVVSDKTTSRAKGRGRGQATPPGTGPRRPGVVTRNRAGSIDDDRQSRIDDMLGPRSTRRRPERDAATAWR